MGCSVFFLRAKIPPFTCARTILECLSGEEAAATPPSEDILSLCRDVILEVIQLKISKE